MIYLRRAFGLTLAILILMATFNSNAVTISRAQDSTQESTQEATATPETTATPESSPTPQNTATPQINAVTIDGSNIVSPVIKASADAFKAKNPDADIQVNVSGTSGGFEKLCNNTLDVNMAVRNISDTEEALCNQKGVKFVELVLGYDALVIVVNNASKATCIGPELVQKLLSPGAANVKNWSAVDATIDAPIDNVYLPKNDTKTYILADSLIVGDQLRTDVKTVDNPYDVADKVASDVNGVGILSLADYIKATGENKTIRDVQIKYPGACIDPTVPNIEQARYSLAETLYLYVNAASLDRKPVADFMNYLLSSDNAKTIASNNFVPASDTIYSRGQGYIANRQTGRTFSRINIVNVPVDVTGTIGSENSVVAYELVRDINNTFNPRYTKVTTNQSNLGTEAGYRKLCTNNIDWVAATRKLTDAEAATCQTTGVQTLQLSAGAKTLVVLVNPKNTFATCLKIDQLAKIFSIDSEGKVKKWSDVSADFPATDLTVFTPDAGSPDTDLLMTKLVKGIAPLARKDAQTNNDALYRAAAVQNVEGGITFVPYDQYKASTSKFTVVKVDAGNGCVEPTEENIKNGTYALAQPIYFVLNVNSFDRPEMKAFVWFLLSDDGLALISKYGLAGTDTAGFVAARDIALERFAKTGGALGTPVPATGTPVPGATAIGTAEATTSVSTETATTSATEATTPAPTEVSTQAGTTAP